MTTYKLTIDSRRRDPETKMVLKYYPDTFKPVRKLEISSCDLTPLAEFIARNCDGTYIGGFHIKSNCVRVEGAIGSYRKELVADKGEKFAIDHMITYDVADDARAVIEAWLFPIIEYAQDGAQYLNATAGHICRLTGSGGRVIINGNVFEIE